MERRVFNHIYIIILLDNYGVRSGQAVSTTCISEFYSSSLGPRSEVTIVTAPIFKIWFMLGSGEK